MKAPLTILLFLTLNVLFAQERPGLSVETKPANAATIRICTPNRANFAGKQKPFYVIFSHDKIISKADTMSAAILPQTIKSFNVLKDSTATLKYGSLGKNGVIEIYLNDDKYPEAYKAFIKTE